MNGERLVFPGRTGAHRCIPPRQPRHYIVMLQSVLSGLFLLSLGAAEIRSFFPAGYLQWLLLNKQTSRKFVCAHHSHHVQIQGRFLTESREGRRKLCLLFLPGLLLRTVAAPRSSSWPQNPQQAQLQGDLGCR